VIYIAPKTQKRISALTKAAEMLVMLLLCQY